MSAYRVLLLAAIVLLASPLRGEERRNPFDLPDVTELNDRANRAFADACEFPPLAKDENAKEWPPALSKGNPMKFEGVWASRWNNGPGQQWYATGKALIVKSNDRLFIRFYSGDDPSAGDGYLIEAVRCEDGTYVGRYSVAGAESSSGHWIGRLVSHERIDGFWTETGRWDFRRKFE